MQFLSNLASNGYRVASNVCQYAQDQVPVYWQATKRKVEHLPTALKKPENQNRCYNGLVAVAVTGSYFLSKSASPQEYFFDVGVHTFHLLLPANASNSSLVVATALDASRVGVIYLRGITNDSTIPTFLNFVDLFNHGYNFIIIGYIAAKNLFVAKDKEE